MRQWSSPFSLPDMESEWENPYWFHKAKLSSQNTVLEENRKKEKEGSKGSGEDTLKATFKNMKDVATTSVTLENWGYGREGIQEKLHSFKPFIFTVS